MCESGRNLQKRAPERKQQKASRKKCVAHKRSDKTEAEADEKKRKIRSVPVKPKIQQKQNVQ